MNDELQKRFACKVKAAVQECHSLDYHPTRFEQMLEQYEPVALAKRMVRSGELQDGLKRLKRMDRLDLSVERIMLEPEFAGLFSSEELAAARWRLDQL